MRKIPELSDTTGHEGLVRYMMVKHAGDPEKLDAIWPRRISSVSRLLSLLEDKYWGKQNKANIDRLMEIAAEEVREEAPRRAKVMPEQFPYPPDNWAEGKIRRRGDSPTFGEMRDIANSPDIGRGAGAMGNNKVLGTIEKLLKGQQLAQGKFDTVLSPRKKSSSQSGKRSSLRRTPGKTMISVAHLRPGLSQIQTPGIGPIHIRNQIILPLAINRSTLKRPRTKRVRGKVKTIFRQEVVDNATSSAS